MLSLRQTASEIILSWVLAPMQSFENRELNLCLGFWGGLVFFSLLQNMDLYIYMVYPRAVCTAHFINA